MKQQQIAFVTGGTGFIGSHIIKRLIKENFQVHISYRPSTTSTRLEGIIQKTVRHNVDIANQEVLEKLLMKIQPDYIFHLANIGVYGGKESPIEDVLRVNTLGTISLLEASKKINLKLFINTGSSSEYGPKNKKMNEEDSCFPESMYGISKLAGTLYAKIFAEKRNRPVVTLRLFSPYGPFDDPLRLISIVCRQALNNELINLTNPTNVRDFVYIDDVVDAYMACVKTKTKFLGEIINIGGGKQHTAQEVINTITSLSQSQSKILINNSVTRYESPMWEADLKRAEKLLNWKPKTSLSKGLEQTVAWHISRN